MPFRPEGKTVGLFEPDRYFSSLAAIDVEWDLARLHLRNVLLDIDNTLRRRDNDEVPPAVRSWLHRAQQKGIKLCLLSNNFHENVHELARELDLPIVAKAMKPLPFGFRRALEVVGGSSEDTVMVGDQLFTDIVGAHLVGMRGYLVCPLVDADLTHTLLVRRVEERILGNAMPEGGTCLQEERLAREARTLEHPRE